MGTDAAAATAAFGDMSDATAAATAKLMGLNAEQAYNLLRTKEMSIDASAAALATNGYSASAVAAAVSTEVLNDEELRATLTAAGFKKSQVDAAMATLAAGGAAGGASTMFDKLTASIGLATKGLWTFLTTTPVGWAILAAGAIAATVAAVDYFTESMDEAIKKAEDSRNAYENAKSEVESLNQELQTTQKRIAELKAQGALTLTEQDELTRLEAENEQLQLQLDIKRKIAEYEQRQAAKDAHNVLSKEAYRVETGETTIAYVQGDKEERPVYKEVNIIEDTLDKQRQLNEAEEKYNRLLEDQSKLTPSDDMMSEYQRNIAELRGFEDRILDYQMDIADNLKIIDESRQSLVDATGRALTGYEDDVRAIDEMYKKLLTDSDKAADAQSKIDKFLNRPSLKNAVDRARELAAAQNGINIDDIISQFPELASAAEEANIELEEVVNTINSMSGALDIDEVKRQLKAATATAVAQSEPNWKVAEGLLSEWNTAWDEFVGGLDDDEIKILYDIYKSNDTTGWSIEDWDAALQQAKETAEEAGISIKASFEEAQEAVDALTTAVSESASATGLSADSITAVEKAFSGLDGYDASVI